MEKYHEKSEDLHHQVFEIIEFLDVRMDVKKLAGRSACAALSIPAIVVKLPTHFKRPSLHFSAFWCIPCRAEAVCSL